MSKKDNLLKQAFAALDDKSGPTEQQKELMLARILMACADEKRTCFTQLINMAIVYPWRFAFAVSACQAVLLTIIFGTQYTRFFLAYIGG